MICYVLMIRWLFRQMKSHDITPVSYTHLIDFFAVSHRIARFIYRSTLPPKENHLYAVEAIVVVATCHFDVGIYIQNGD